MGMELQHTDQEDDETEGAGSPTNFNDLTFV